MGEPPILRQRTFMGHPPGLAILFLTQMWERFSYFGMLALLILYLNQYFKLSQDAASNVFKWYTSAIFFSPLIGGYLADRYLGNKRAIMLGTLLMAVGHFLLALPTLSILYVALGFLVVGFGFLTPPLLTQVGLLYPPGDGRRDSAYTIFYMGINLGALISPLACGWLLENTRGGFHSALTLPGIGMVLALGTYLFGLRWVVEVEQTKSGPTPAEETPGEPALTPGADATRLAVPSEIEQTPSALPALNALAPLLLTSVGVVLTLAAPVLYFTSVLSLDNTIGVFTAAVCAFLFAWVAASVHHGLRDRVLAILALFVFTIVYWIGAGQNGNAINLWADQNTNRYVTQPLPPPDIYPQESVAIDSTEAETGDGGVLQRFLRLFERRPQKEEAGDPWYVTSWNPVPTPWFQSINPLMILLLAPLFALLWTWLDRRGLNPSIPVKMGLGVLLMALAFGVMVLAAQREAQPSSVPLPGGLPSGLMVDAQNQVCPSEEGKPGAPVAAGRLHFDSPTNSLRVVGVLPDLTRDAIVRDTVPADLAKRFDALSEQTAKAAEGAKGWQVHTKVGLNGRDFDLRYAGLGKPTGNADIRYDPATQTLTVSAVVEDKEVKGLKVAAGDPTFRAALNDLMKTANGNRVSSWWLIVFFLLATMGELCLAPVGFSMVSQLAPPRFATMLMGLWLLTWAFANFAAGAFGEQWGAWAPLRYFGIMALVQGAAAVLLLVMVRQVGALMHEERSAH